MSKSNNQQINKIDIVKWLNAFPEVLWDRYSIEDGYWFYGWIKREDSKFDFLCLGLTWDGKVIAYDTSSAKYSEEFAKRLGLKHITCERVESLLEGVNCIKL